MKAKNKQRIVGGLVLLAVAAIFLPLLFHNPHPSTNFSVPATSPPEPDKPVVQFQLPPSKFEHVVPQPVTKEVISEVLQQSPLSTAISGTNEGVKDEGKPVQIDLKPVDQSGKSSNHLQPNVSKSPLSPSGKEVLQPKLFTSRVMEEKKSPFHQSMKSRLKISSQSHPIVSHPHLKLLSSIPKAWVIQVASFSHSENARRLLSQLRAKGFDAFVRESKGKKTLTRVFIGPDINQTKIDRIQKEIKQKMQLNGVIKRYVTF